MEVWVSPLPLLYRPPRRREPRVGDTPFGSMMPSLLLLFAIGDGDRAEEEAQELTANRTGPWIDRVGWESESRGAHQDDGRAGAVARAGGGHRGRGNADLRVAAADVAQAQAHG